MSDRVHERALLRAAGILGGIDPLAERLHVHPAVLISWMRGTTKVPQEVFLAVVDIVLERNLDGLKRDPGLT